jgi:hypothetical protein
MKEVCLVVGSTVLIGYLLFVLICSIAFVTERSQCVVKVDNAVWFTGKAYNVLCEGSGTNVKCIENGGNVFTLLASKRKIISSNVQMECK